MESTIKKPLKFFFRFFKKGYLIHWNNFFKEDPRLEPDIKVVEINKKKEYVTTVAFHNNGEESVYTAYYKDVITSTLEEESKKSIHVLKANIKELSKEGKNFSYYLEAILGELNELRGIILNTQFLLKYDSFIESIYKITLFIITEYPLIIIGKEKLPVIKAAKKFEKDQAKNKDHKSEDINKIKVFSWKDKTEGVSNTEKLYGVIKGIAVEEDNNTLKSLKIAFSGKALPLDAPLKIKWIFKKGENTKPPLIRIFNLLMNELKVIGHIDSVKTYTDTLEFIFVDELGNKLQHTKNSYYEVIRTKKIPTKEQELHKKIRNLFPDTET